MADGEWSANAVAGAERVLRARPADAPAVASVLRMLTLATWILRPLRKELGSSGCVAELERMFRKSRPVCDAALLLAPSALLCGLSSWELLPEKAQDDFSKRYYEYKRGYLANLEGVLDNGARLSADGVAHVFASLLVCLVFDTEFLGHEEDKFRPLQARVLTLALEHCDLFVRSHTAWAMCSSMELLGSYRDADDGPLGGLLRQLIRLLDMLHEEKAEQVCRMQEILWLYFETGLRDKELDERGEAAMA
ncbi:hypothetical protein T492DRAFT_909839, partial [Pavlovales sp. CCMP2436]